jgi:glycosyltransferase involved in cell wall biosynthesis
VLLTVVLWLFLLAVAAQLIYAFYFFRRISALPAGKSLTQAARRPVSVIICAKNEAANLKKNLPAILAQRYTNDAGIPLFEVVVVNDASTDDSEAVIMQLQQQYDHLQYVAIPLDADRALKGKKFALSKGVVAAQNDWLLLTDADCMPASGDWLGLMTAPLAERKEIVAGYGGFYRRPGVLNAFIRWETKHTFLQYSTYIMAGRPYMAVGRNMACTKYIVLKAQRSEVWNEVTSGDDDLLVSVGADEHNTAVVADRDAFTWSEARATWNEWIHQKQRHLSTGKYYNDNLKALLGFYGASHTDVWICFFILLFSSQWKTAAAIMVVRCVVYWVIWGKAARRLNEKRLIFLFPFFDIGWMVYNFAFFPYITWKNKEHWK